MYCRTCWLEFNSEYTLNIHLNTKQHLESVKFQNDLKLDCFTYPNYCEVCSIYTNSAENLIIHLASQKHLSKLEAKNIIENTINKNKHICELCDCSFESIELLVLHFSGLEHKENLIKCENISKYNLEDENYLIKINGLNKKYLCTLCKISMNSEITKKRHLNSEKHEKELSKLKIIKEIKNNQQQINSNDNNNNELIELEWCSTCYIRYTSESHRNSHLEGKEHLKKVYIKNMSDNKKFKYLCVHCNTNLNSEDQFYLHNQSPSHMIQFKRYEEFLKLNKLKRNFETNILDDSFENDEIKNKQIFKQEMQTGENLNLIKSNEDLNEIEKKSLNKPNFKKIIKLDTNLFKQEEVEILKYDSDDRLKQKQELNLMLNSNREYKDEFDSIDKCLNNIYALILKNFRN